MDLSFSKYDLQKGGEQITGYSISEMNKNSYAIIYRNVIVRIKLLNHFPFQVIVKYHVIVHVVLKYLVMRITIVFAILVHMNI